MDQNSVRKFLEKVWNIAKTKGKTFKMQINFGYIIRKSVKKKENQEDEEYEMVYEISNDEYYNNYQNDFLVDNEGREVPRFINDRAQFEQVINDACDMMIHQPQL